ncbi:MAG TPA: cytochrome P450 [Allosphingosinicella sp.]|jgi:cytochrome P450
MSARFVPPHPPRGSGPVPVWRGFFGERARNAIYGWSEQAFTADHIKRKVLGIRVHIPLTPQAVQRVLLDNASNYIKPRLIKKLLGRTIGEGLLTADGPLWRDQRRIVAASFTPPAVDALVPVFADVAAAAAQAWQGGVRDMGIESTAATMRVISNALFSGDPRLTSEAAMRHIAEALDGISEARLQILLGLPVIPMSRKGRAAHRGQTYLRETLTAVVRDRLAGGGPDDFLGGLIRDLHARFPADQALALAVDNAATFYLAGHETTANAITWTLFLLSEQGELQEQAAAEAQAALTPGADADLPDRLPLLRRILEESMRLYPPVPRLDREALGPDTLGGVPIVPGEIVSIWPWLLHRHQALWDDADAFMPDRFAPENRGARHRFQYLPFGGGPRLCVGMRFAMAEALTILATWLARWRFAPVPGREVRPSGLVTLRPAGGLPLTLTPRA